MCNWFNDNIQFPRLLAELMAVGLDESVWDDLCASMDLESDQLSELFERAQHAWEKIKLANCPPPSVQARESIQESINETMNALGVQERRYDLDDGTKLCVKLGDDGLILDVENDIGEVVRTQGMEPGRLADFCY